MVLLPVTMSLTPREASMSTLVAIGDNDPDKAW
jgi:hypothetical protein